ncbi:MAG TPA: peptidylprolyl isomerase [Candidatus Limnocylindrales bacterium]|nr:peptidylprolyl isomerase [Candidatus Limnocylindrales bacterium]
MKRYFVSVPAVLAAILLVSCKHGPPAGVAAEVNGHAITYSDLDKTFRSAPQQPPEGATPDTIENQKLDLLNSLITNEIMLQKAEKLGLTAVDADVDGEFNKLKAPYTKEEFARQLEARHMTEADLRAQLRRDLTLSKLINKEITSHVVVTDAEVAGFYNANKALFNLPEPRIHMAQILVTPDPNGTAHNLKSSKAHTEQEAKNKISELDARLKRGEDFAMLAQNYSEDDTSAPNGGDMGFIPQSTLDKASPELRKMVFSLPPNGVSGVIHTSDGLYRILKVISKEPAGQRDLNDPRVQQEIHENLFNQKDNLLKAAYVEAARNAAKIVNYLAIGIVDNAAKSK